MTDVVRKDVTNGVSWEAGYGETQESNINPMNLFSEKNKIWSH